MKSLLKNEDNSTFWENGPLYTSIYCKIIFIILFKNYIIPTYLIFMGRSLLLSSVLAHLNPSFTINFQKELKLLWKAVLSTAFL